MKKVLMAALGLSLVAGLSVAQTPIRVGMAFDAGGKNDRSFNQSAFEGAQKAGKDLGAEISDFEPSDPSQVGQGIQNFSQDGFDLIVGVGFANEPSITKAAKDFPDLKFAVVDSVSDQPNVAGLVFKEQQGSYLVGYIAGKTSSTGVVGFVGGMDIPLIHKFNAGYAAGVKAACPTCKVLSQYVGTTPDAWNNPTKAKEIANAQQAQGTDIIYAAAGASGGGVQNWAKETKCISAAKLPKGLKFKGTDPAAKVAKAKDYSAKCKAGDRPVYFIGVDSNQNYIGDTDNNPKTLNHGLTSMLKRVDVAVYQVIKDVSNDSFKGGAREFDLSDNGIGYALDEYNKGVVSAATIDGVEKAKAAIIAGTIKVPVSKPKPVF